MNEYEDIIRLPHHQSETRAHMPMRDRAAQFAPFAALTGYDAVIEESARYTDSRIELTETAREMIDRTLRDLSYQMPAGPEAVICYFVPDERKQGGAYLTVSGGIKKIDETEHSVTLTDGRTIRVEDIYSIEQA